MKEDKRTSVTPYWEVVSIRSSEKAIPGKTLERVIGHPEGLSIHDVLGEEYHCSSRYNSVVPSVGPIRKIVWCTSFDVGNHATERPETMTTTWLQMTDRAGGVTLRRIQYIIVVWFRHISINTEED
jgi:hypothetical protein